MFFLKYINKIIIGLDWVAFIKSFLNRKKAFQNLYKKTNNKHPRFILIYFNIEKIFIKKFFFLEGF